MSEEREIPKGWILTYLGEVCKLKNGCAFKSSEYLKDWGIPIIRISDIGEGKVDLTNCVRIKEDDEYDNYVVHKNEILVAMSGATTGKFGIYKGEEKVYQNQRVGKFEILYKEALSNSYLLYLLYSLKNRILEDAYGGAQPNISSGKIEELPFPLPPLPEQHRIVAKIEELFSSLDKGIESLKTAQQQLKVYRQAVLKWAFEGKLTNKDVQEGELPEGWKWKSIKEITSVLGDGLHGTPQYDENGDYFFINGNNLSDGKIEIKDNTKRVSKSEFEKYKKPLNENTVLVSINGTLGNTAFYNNEKVILGKSACYFNVLEKIDKKYIRYCITSHRFVNYANKNATGSTIKNVGLKAMREFEIPLPQNLEEQQLIVSEIESRLSVCDKIEESITTSLQQSEALRQSILKKAFEGKLVPQDPNDEPALVLLERIKEEREALRQAQGKNKPVKKAKEKIVNPTKGVLAE